MGIRVTNGSKGPEKVRIGLIEVDPASCLLTCGTTSTRLSPRAMNVLTLLTHRAGSTVAYDELLDRFWRGSLSSKNAIHKCAAELRLAFDRLGDDAVRVENVSKRGYRLIAAVTSVDADVAEEQSFAPMIVSVGTRTAVIKPIKPGGSTSRGKTFAQRIRSEMVTQLNQLTNVVVREQTEVTLSGKLSADYAVDFDVQDTDSQLYATVAVTPASELPSHQEHFDSSVVLHETIRHIVDTLVVLLDVDHVERMRQWGTRNVEAYRATFEGDLLRRSHTFDAMEGAAALFVRALEKDPRFALAYCWLAAAYKDLGRVATDTPIREQLRQQAQAVLRSARRWRIDPETILEIERLCRYMSFGNPFDAEAFWRSEIIKDPGNADALLRYGDLLRGSNLIDESAAYLARVRSLTDEDSREWLDQTEPSIALARGEFERAVALMKRNLERFPDLTQSTYGLVGTLAKLGRYPEAEFYLSRLEATDAVWAYFARLTMGAMRGDFSPRSNELAHLFADPHADNAMRGAVSFILGDVAAGVGYWREIEPASLPRWWDYITGIEWYWAPGVVDNPHYQALLDELGFGRRWRAYMRSKAAELTSITGIEVTTPPPPEEAGSSTVPFRIPARR